MQKDSEAIQDIEQDEIALAVASLEGIEMETDNAPLLTEKEKEEMEALRQAVESITAKENPQNAEELEQNILPVSTVPVESTSSETLETNEDENTCVSSVNDNTMDEKESIEIIEISHNSDKKENESNKLKKESSMMLDSNEANEDVLPDSSQSLSDDNETVELTKNKEKDSKNRFNEKPRRHKKSSDNKLEDINVNVDVVDREKCYSPKITIKPIKVPDEEVSTTTSTTLETDSGKGCLKMTITKQSDKMHSILKVCDNVEQSPPESVQDEEEEEPLPKLKIKPTKPTVEQPVQKMSTRSSRQVQQTVANTTQRSCSPRITIKPVVKPETLSPLKIKIGLKTEDSSKKHSPKLKQEEAKEAIPSPRKVLIKPVVKPTEDDDQAPKIIIKPIPKPDLEKESASVAGVPTVSTKLNIKPIKKPEEEEIDAQERTSSPKITIKPIVKPQEPDSLSDDVEDESKKRIVLKINKGKW